MADRFTQLLDLTESRGSHSKSGNLQSRMNNTMDDVATATFRTFFRMVMFKKFHSHVCLIIIIYSKTPSSDRIKTPPPRR